MNSYRSQSRNKSSDSDSGDSENEGSWKRRQYSSHAAASATDRASTFKMDVDSSSQAIINNESTVKPKKRMNNIWCNVLQERSLADEFGTSFKLKKKSTFFCDRSSESYDYTRKALDTRVSSDEEDPEGEYKLKKNGLIHNKTEKIKKECLTHNITRNYDINDEDIAKIARRISNVLNEPKKYLIYKIVKVIGPDKALDLLRRTNDVELNGGMQIMNGSRRRTPGGVYIQLVKSDPDIDQKKLENVFMDDRKMMGKDRKLKKKLPMKKKSSMTMSPVNAESSANKSEKVCDFHVKEAQETMDLDLCASVTCNENKPDILPEQNTQNDSEIEDGEIVD